MSVARICFFTLIFFSSLVPASNAQDEAPRSTDPRLKIELYAESPQIVTPTGIDVDHAGRVWAIESNTHFPPEGYKGHPTDRILIFEGRAGDGRAQKSTVFKDALVHSMSIAVKPVWLDLFQYSGAAASDTASTKPQPNNKTEVFIATRREILLCTDTTGDLQCDDVKQLVHLETAGNYPHNGLAGFAFDAEGFMYFGFGENLGADYKIIGSDGVTLSGGGEGGNVYRCRPDGSKLQRWATGFWNPHASCFDSLGRLFSLDNDPDSRPPCRLLHLVEGGDYGYRFRNGRKGTHPYSAWNGEIVGTLPMVSGTGEAPSGIICYESDGFPDDYFGKLLVGSWGDHRIDKFVLKPRGESFESMPQPFIKGDENFRPVGLAVAPDGSLFVTDWVSKEYKLHGLGRVWRISAKDEPPRAVVDVATISAPRSRDELKQQLKSHRLDVRRTAALQTVITGHGDWCRELLDQETKADIGQRDLRLTFELNSVGPRKTTAPQLKDMAAQWPLAEQFLSRHAREEDPFVLTQAMTQFAFDDAPESWFVERLTERNWAGTRWRTAFLGLTGRRLHPKSQAIPKSLLASTDTTIRRMGVQWIGEEYLKVLRIDVERTLATEPMTADLFMACLASLSLLDGVAPAEFEKNPPAQYAMAIAGDAKRPAHLRAIALRMVPPNEKLLTARLLEEMATSTDDELQREAVRTLQLSNVDGKELLLRAFANDQRMPVSLRADAIAGLVQTGQPLQLNDETRQTLSNLCLSTVGNNLEIRLEALRSLRGPLSRNAAVIDESVAATLKQLATNFANEPEMVREKLSEAVEFANGTRKSAAPAKLLVGFQTTGNRNPDEREKLGVAADAGRRTFFHPNGPGCYKCHMVGGRGGQIGPDLTVIARTMDRKKLAESILIPSKEISPQFTTWSIETTSGKVLSGLLLGEEVNGDLRLGSSQGEVIFVPFREVESRTPVNTSVMPEKLHETMTDTEFRDLIDFLESLK